MVTIVFEYRLHNEKAEALIAKIFSKVLRTDYTIVYLVDEYFSADDYAVIKDKDYEARITEPTIETDILIALGARCSKYFSKEKLLNKSMLSSYVWNDVKVFTNYSPIHVLNNYETYIKKFVDQFYRAINVLDIPEVEYTKYKIIDSLEELQQVIDWCTEEETFCFDFETTGLVWFRDVPTILSISFNPGFSYIIPIYHYESKFKGGEKFIFDIIRPIFENPKVVKYGHNIKFDLHFILRYCTTNLRGRYVDSLLMHHLLDENSKHGLKELTKVFFPEFSNYELSIKGRNWATIPLKELSQYAAIDTDITLRLCIQFEADLMADDANLRLYNLFRNFTSSAILPILRMEHRGAKIDRKYIEKSIKDAHIVADNLYAELRSFKELKRFETIQGRELKQKKIIELETKIATAKPHFAERYRKKIDALLASEDDFEINLNSTQQLGDLLFSKEGLGLPLYYDPYEKKHTRTTKRAVLKAYNHPFVEAMFEYRTVLKLISTSYEGILNKLDDNDMLHTSFLLHGTATGRLSSREPNLQNLPSTYKYSNKAVEDLYKRPKKFFITKPGKMLMWCDFSQAELRCIANLSQDPVMIEAYLSGKDLHTITASGIEGCTVEEFMKLPEDHRKVVRNSAKNANFGYVYGCTTQTYIATVYAGSGVVISEATAQRHRDGLFNVYKELVNWHKRYIKLGEKYGYVRTLFGRKRRLQNINNRSNHRLKAADERIAINAPVQGTAGEWNIFAMVILDLVMGEDLDIFNSIHDANYFYIYESEIDLFKKHVSDISVNPLIECYFTIDPKLLTVKMKLDFDTSRKSWGEKD